jgi:hypothetical protein
MAGCDASSGIERLRASPNPSIEAKMAARTPSTYATSSSRIADGSVAGLGAGLPDGAGFDGDDGTVGVDPVGGDECIDGLGAVQAVVVGLDAEIGGRGVAPSVIHDLLMWATALTFSIRSTYRHSVARLEGFLTQDRRASACDRATECPRRTPEPAHGNRESTTATGWTRRLHAPSDLTRSGRNSTTAPCH